MTTLAAAVPADTLWALAQTQRHNLIVSTLFTARDVSAVASTEVQLQEAIQWCRHNGITKAFLETFRDGYQVSQDVLIRARDAFRAAGVEVAGCITPTQMGDLAQVRDASGKFINSQYLSCYSSRNSQEMLERLFVLTAAVFDEIIIDDFYCTECECDVCEQARGRESRAEFRTGLMLRMSTERVLGPVRLANPRCRVIIKYPNWYDHYRTRGYDVDRQTKAFDHIYSGTETREPTGPTNPQYQAYFIMRWLSAAGGKKNLGGWFDYIDTQPATFVEQAHQTVLGGARQLMLYAYGPLSEGAGAMDLAALRDALPTLFRLAALIKDREPRGVLACRPMCAGDVSPADRDGASLSAEDAYCFGALGMLGLPLVPAIAVDPDARAAVFTRHALYDEAVMAGLATMVERQAPVLLTEGLARAQGRTSTGNTLVLETGTNGEKLRVLPVDQLNRLRDALLAPWGITFHGPARVGLYLFGEALVVFANFNDQEVQADFVQSGMTQGVTVLVIPETASAACQHRGSRLFLTLAPRSLVAVAVRYSC